MLLDRLVTHLPNPNYFVPIEIGWRLTCLHLPHPHSLSPSLPQKNTCPLWQLFESLESGGSCGRRPGTQRNGDRSEVSIHWWTCTAWASPALIHPPTKAMSRTGALSPQRLWIPPTKDSEQWTKHWARLISNLLLGDGVSLERERSTELELVVLEELRYSFLTLFLEQSIFHILKYTWSENGILLSTN